MAQANAPAGRGSHYSSITSTIFSFSLALSAGLASFCFATKAESLEPAKLTAWTGGSKPAFVLDDLHKTKVSLNLPPSPQPHHEVVIVHFFATWCEPCREELPALRRLVERTDPKRLRLITISAGEVDVRVRNFVEKLPVNFPILLDRDRGVARSWGALALPTTFVLDRDLRPRLFVERDYDWDQSGVSAFLKWYAAEQTGDPPFDNNTAITTTGKTP